MSRFPRIPPLALLIIAGLCMWLLRHLFPGLALQQPWLPQLALPLAALGLVLCISTLHTFRRAQTTVDPRHPQQSTRLITHGPMRISRNPIYLGLLLVLLSWSLLAQHGLAFAVVPLFFLYLDRIQIPAEEVALRQLFAAEYAVYCSRVRRWL